VQGEGDAIAAALARALEPGACKRLLLEGFPRHRQDLDAWFRRAHDDVTTLGALLYVGEDGGGASGELAKVAERLQAECTVRSVAGGEAAAVWRDAELALDGWWAESGKEMLGVQTA
jgi:hypothetical protein